jgi:hypothetical protein
MSVQRPDSKTDAPARTGIALTHFDFRHAVFRTPGARFLLSGNKRVPTFRIDIGDLDGLIDIDALCREFNITADSNDGKLVALAVDGLRFVPDIKPGDAIPTELITGQASWSVKKSHKKIAQDRLQIQLLSWMSGKEVLITDPNEIGMFLDQIENREKLRQAFREAATALGRAPEDTDYVVGQLELIARELCYIEALRDRLGRISVISTWLKSVAKARVNDRIVKLEIQRIDQLLQSGIAEYTVILTEADAQTGEIISALKTIDRQIEYIRRMRDDLYSLLLQWEPHLKAMEPPPTPLSPEAQKTYGALYRFLAPRYTAGRSILRRHPIGQPAGDGKTPPARPPAGARPGT